MWKTALVLLAVLTAPARAEIPAQIDLLPGWRTKSGTHMAGLRIRLDAGWKTYWRAPGDAGIPPQFTWAAGDVVAVQPYWPSPSVDHSGGMRTIVYHDAVVIPLEVTLAPGTGAARIEGRVDLGLCQEICMPVSVTLSGTLPSKGRRSPEITAALLDRPARVTGALGCDIRPSAEGVAVQLRLSPAVPRGAEAVLETGQADHWVSPLRIETHAGQSVLTAQVQASGPVSLARDALRLTVMVPGQGATEYLGCAPR